MTQRAHTAIGMGQFYQALAHAYLVGNVNQVVVDSGTNYIHYYVDGVLSVSTKWDNCAQISNEWLARHRPPQETQ